MGCRPGEAPSCFSSDEAAAHAAGAAAGPPLGDDEMAASTSSTEVRIFAPVPLLLLALPAAEAGLSGSLAGGGISASVRGRLGGGDGSAISSVGTLDATDGLLVASRADQAECLED